MLIPVYFSISGDEVVLMKPVSSTNGTMALNEWQVSYSLSRHALRKGNAD
jgi:hypothetical protein